MLRDRTVINKYVRPRRLDNFSVGQIARTENPEFAVGDYVAGYFRECRQRVRATREQTDHLCSQPFQIILFIPTETCTSSSIV